MGGQPCGKTAPAGVAAATSGARCVCCSWRQLFQLCSYSSAASSCSCASWAWVSGWACAMPTWGRVPGPAGQDHAQLAWAMSSGASHAQLGQPCPIGPAAVVASCSQGPPFYGLAIIAAGERRALHYWGGALVETRRAAQSAGGAAHCPQFAEGVKMLGSCSVAGGLLFENVNEKGPGQGGTGADPGRCP